MTDTFPHSNIGTDDENERIRIAIAERGLVGAANDVKWGCLLYAMRQPAGCRPFYRYKCVDASPSGWDVELASPMLPS